MPGRILTKTEFATRREVTVSAVCKWIERGRICCAALTAGDRIVVIEAEAQLSQSLDHAKSQPVTPLNGRHIPWAGAGNACDLLGLPVAHPPSLYLGASGGLQHNWRFCCIGGGGYGGVRSRGGVAGPRRCRPAQISQ